MLMSRSTSGTATPQGMDGPDYSARDAAGLVRIFEFFGEVECPQLDAHLYESLCRGIVEDEVLLEMASHAPPNQPPPEPSLRCRPVSLAGGCRASSS